MERVLRLLFAGGKAATFDVGTVSPTLRIGVPFDIPLGIKDSYGHAVEPPPNLKPVLQCRWVPSVNVLLFILFFF